MIDLPWPVILASGSPRRERLLRTLVREFRIWPADVDEGALILPDPVDTAELLSQAKARAAAAEFPGALSIAGDTVVAVASPTGGFRQLGKPESAEEAERMLRLLGGRAHLVVTGMSLIAPGHAETFHDVTEVVFRRLSSLEIKRYVAGGEPMDKAGAYAIQGGAAAFVERVAGSINNVVGLPTERLEERLREIARLHA